MIVKFLGGIGFQITNIRLDFWTDAGNERSLRMYELYEYFLVLHCTLK